MKTIYAIMATVAINFMVSSQGDDHICLQDFHFVSAIKKDCDTYKVYYREDFQVKSFTGNLYEIQKLGISTDDVIEYYYSRLNAISQYK